MTTQPRTVETFRLVLPAAVISLAVTLLRLAGELGRWSEPWFSREAGGIAPSGVSWIVGITWLPLPFGVYFAWELAQEGLGPKSPRRALALALGGVVLALGGLRLVRLVPLEFPDRLVLFWLVLGAAGTLQFWGWPALTRLMLIYAYTARVPVVVVMLLAMWREWGTHYDYFMAPASFQMPFWPRFFWLAFFPQLVFWVGYTLVLGALAGALTALVAQRRRVA